MKELEKKFIKSYDQYSDEIFRFVLFKLNNREKAKDILQETFMKTWLYISKNSLSGEKMREIGNIRAFLYKTASNSIIDEYRRQDRKDNRVESLDTLSEFGFEPVFDDTDSWIDKIDGKQAMEMIKKLPEIYSEVLFLRYSGEQSISEIAKIMNQTDNTISVRLNRAIKKLKEMVINKEIS